MLDLKTIAIYLPQYHRVKENDEWWGEGFTEWTAVRQAEKYYPSHNQPRVPLNENYYDLDDRKTFEWQAELAKEYGVYGFCFYHYYFKDGRRILERPAENLLKWTDIPMNFCFSWANASWERTWNKYNLAGTWTSKFEVYREEESPILLEQNYGDKTEWTAHFNYLLPFFRDERYIKIDGKPVFIFHLPNEIECLDEMVQTWRLLAEENGLPGVYLIGEIQNEYQEYSSLDALYEQEPGYSYRDYIVYSDETKKELCSRYNEYEEVCKWGNLKRNQQKQKMYFSAFPGYDTTPRHGTRGVIIDKSTPEKFETCFREVCRKSLACNNEVVFINAWNEWGEGNYLEPDETFGYGYLEAIRRVLEELEESDIPESKVWEMQDIEIFWKVLMQKERMRTKFQYQVRLLNKWLSMLEDDNEVSTYFEQNNYQKIAIYGMGILAKHLQAQLKEKIDIAYFIDRKAKIDNYSIPILGIDDVFPEVDVIVVTVVDEYEEIQEQLRKKYSGKIISLTEIITL